MISKDEQMAVFEMALQPGWDFVLREVMEKVNSTGQEALSSIRPGKDADEQMFKSGQHQGVLDLFEYLKRMEKDAHSHVAARDEKSGRPLKTQ
jgi:hypothetical protein